MKDGIKNPEKIFIHKEIRYSKKENKINMTRFTLDLYSWEAQFKNKLYLLSDLWKAQFKNKLNLLFRSLKAQS